MTLDVTTRKAHTGYERRIEGFTVPHFFVHRNSNGLYDVYVHVKNGRDFDLFSIPPAKIYQDRIFTDLPTRKEAVRVAQFARDRLFQIVAQQIAEWEGGQGVRALLELQTS